MPSCLNDTFFAALDSSIGDINQAETLPPACYTDPDFFEFEKEAVFNHDWLCVGRESWVNEPGAFFTISHVGEPLVVTRTPAGEIKALSAVCQHRAMLVAEGHGKARAFRCPYHHWTYGLDGELLAAPAMDRACNFEMSSIRLPELKVEVWLGFIFVNFDRAAPPLAPQLRPLEAALAPYGFAAADGPTLDELAATPYLTKYPWNWKVQFENSNDGYHANRLHHGPIHDMVPGELAVFPDLPPGTAGYFRYNGTTGRDIGFNPTKKAVLPLFPGLGDEDRQRCVFVNVPPTLTIFARVDYVLWTIMCADGPEAMTHIRGWLVAPGAKKTPMFKELLALTTSGSVEIGQQDRHVDGLVQQGLRSRFAPRGRYSWQEGSQIALNRWLVARYRAAWTRWRGGDAVKLRAVS